ncbi:hypothetical protein F9B74_03330 [Pelistega sp. NLN82]|uniref:Uncharacterized protein n=1 Tax=Pelistega ratti TaxID=2652177 RepID=A0A6L9Y4K5_9BURK|nr:hypothetical protein [Pelistega ratti]
MQRPHNQKLITENVAYNIGIRRTLSKTREKAYNCILIGKEGKYIIEQIE